MGLNKSAEALESADITLDVGYYDPFSIFQGGFRSDFQSHVTIPSFYWKDNRDSLHVLKNVSLNFLEETPRFKVNSMTFLKFMFISCQNIEDYRATVRPLMKQWIEEVKEIVPKTPYFIVFFENTELRTATDKYLKTNLINKIKTDFENHEFNIETIFKIKSMYPNLDDRIMAWKGVTSSVTSLLADSINTKLLHYAKNPAETALVFQNLKQNEESLACFHKLYSTIPFIHRVEVEKPDLQKVLSTLNSESLTEDIKESSLLKKTWYYAQQSNILKDPNVNDHIYLKNVTRLGQTLFSFLNSLEICFRRCEISFIMVTQFMGLPRLSDIIQMESPMHKDLISCLGKLKHLQRNDLIMLGTSRGFHVKGSLTLADVPFSGNEEYIMEDENLTKIMASQKLLITTVVEITREIIELYDTCGINNNTIAVLSTELALILYYSAEDYEASCDQLIKSYEFFLANGWRFIGIQLLEIFIQNLDKLIETRGSDVVSQLLNKYLNLAFNGNWKFDARKFRLLSNRLSKKKIVKVENLISCDEISPVFCEEAETYSIIVYLHSKLEFKFDEVKLTFRNKDNKTVAFSANNIMIGNRNAITLNSSKLLFGEFESTNLSIITGNLEVLQKVKANIQILPITKFQCPKSGAVVQNSTSSISIPRTRYLNTDQLIISLKSGDNYIQKPELHLLKTDPDKLNPSAIYEVFTTDGTNEEPVEFEIEDSAKSIIFKVSEFFKLPPGFTIAVKFPYYFPPDVTNTVLDLYYKVKYLTLDSSTGKSRECLQEHFSQIDSCLPIAVAAEETFRSAENANKGLPPSFSIFSRLTINSISAIEPVRIQNVNLMSEEFKIETWKAPKDIIAFFEQGTTYFFKITEFGAADVTLNIEYSTMKDEILEILEVEFTNFITKLYPDLLKSQDIYMLHSVARKIWKCTPFKLNFYALSGRILPESTDSIQLEELAKYFKNETKGEYEKILTEFFTSLKSLSNTKTVDVAARLKSKRNLIITVKMPEINIASIVEYKFNRELQYRVCEPIQMTVELTVHLLKMSSDQIEEFGDCSSKGKKVRFQNKDDDSSESVYLSLDLDMVDPEQKWIISGMKHLEANILLSELLESKSSKFSYDITLIPLKTGKLQLPSLSVKNKNYKDLVMELDYRNTAESLLVVSELNKIIHSF